jgi:hypothetical protein
LSSSRVLPARDSSSALRCSTTTPLAFGALSA